MQEQSNLLQDEKHRGRTTTHMLYQLIKWCLGVYIGYICLLGLILLTGLIFDRSTWGAFLLSAAVPWKLILPISLLVIIIFPVADTFIQSKEESWFLRYGTQIIAKVVGTEQVQFRRLSILSRFFTEQRLQLEWQHPENGQTYHYTLRVREQRMPHWGTNLPILIDYDDPSYYWKADVKDPSLRF
ncbi:MAG TPA: hypothetical protein VL461_15845 [Dictyobacter sp.]|jgi:hypothetical protein|nr:hypothetical protein [Dictyobacter sp.]